MSSFKDSLFINHNKETVMSAIKAISASYKSITLTDADCYDLRCHYSFWDACRAYPVTISVEIVSAGNNGCRVEVYAHNFGLFENNRFECMTRLSEFKSLLSNELASYNKPTQTSAADEILKYKQLLDMGAISEEEYAKQKDALLNKNNNNNSF